jgi:phage host-nuclease inhibitor protein Gam
LELNKSIDSLKEEADRAASPLLAQKEKLEIDIEQFTESKKAEFKDVKSKKFLYGTVGYRKASSLITRNVKAIIEALKQHRMIDCINTTEKINKEELEKYDDEALKKVGAKRKVVDKFYYELNEERIEA